MRTWRAALALLLIAVGSVSAARSDKAAQAQTGGWVTEAPLPVAKTGLVAVTGVDGRVYVFGGTDNATQDYSDAEVYDPTSNVWRGIAPLPVAESYPSAILGLDNKIYIFGGFNSISGQSLNNVFAYDPATNTYACSANDSGCASSSLAPMPTARSVMAITQSEDGKMWTIGGYTSQPVATVEVYDPAANTWTEEPALPSPESGAAAAGLPTGDVLVWGGFDGQTYNPSTFLLALPKSNSSPLASVTDARHKARPNSELRRNASVQRERPLRASLTSDVPYWCKYPRPKQINEVKWLVFHHKNDQEVESKLGGNDWAIGILALLFGGDPLALQNALDYVCNNFLHFSEARASGTNILHRSHPSVASHQSASSVQLPPIVFSGGDSIGGVGTDVGVYDWLADSWSRGPSLPSPREGAASTYGPNGTTYVIGGDDGKNVYSTVFAWTPPQLTLNLPAPSTPTPTATVMANPTPIPTVISTSTPTATATNTAIPSATPTALALTAHLAVKSHKVQTGQRQTLTVTTAAGARVAITVTFPDRKKLHHSGSVGASGRFTWHFKEPKGTRAGLKVAVAVTVTYLGSTAHTSAHYTTG